MINNNTISFITKERKEQAIAKIVRCGFTRKQATRTINELHARGEILEEPTKIAVTNRDYDFIEIIEI